MKRKAVAVLLALAVLTGCAGTQLRRRQQMDQQQRAAMERQQQRTATRAMVEERLAALGGPEAALMVEEVHKGRIPFCKTEELEQIKRFRSELEPMLLERLRNGDHAAAYMLAFLKSEKALTTLKEKLVNDRYMFRWDYYDFSEEETYMRDEVYPHHVAYIAAIEHITGGPIWMNMPLSAWQRSDLQQDAAKANPQGRASQYYVSKWLLEQFMPPDKMD